MVLNMNAASISVHSVRHGFWTVSRLLGIGAAQGGESAVWKGAHSASGSKKSRLHAHGTATHAKMRQRSVSLDRASCPNPFSAVVSPLPAVMTALFFVGMAASTLMFSLSSPIHSSAQIMSAVVGSHVYTDIIACVFGAAVSCRVSSPSSLINPEWAGGSLLRRHGVPMLKACMVCVLAYVLGCMPVVGAGTVAMGNASLPGTLLFSLAIICSMCAFGYAIGVVIASRWSLVIAAAVGALCMWLGAFVFAHSGSAASIVPERVGSPIGLVFANYLAEPVEPGMRISNQALFVQLAFRLALIVICLALVVVYARLWIPRSRALMAGAVAVLLVVPSLLAGLIAFAGPKFGSVVFHLHQCVLILTLD